MGHVIKQQVFDFKVDQQVDPFGIQQRISDRFWIDILPELEKLFDQFSLIGDTIKIESLQVDLGVITPEMIDNGEWGLLIRKALQSGLSEAMRNFEVDRNIRIEPSFESSFSKWYFFIEHGYLPWNAGKPSAKWLDQVLESIARSYTSAIKLKDILKSNSKIAKRMAIYHAPGFLSHIVELMTAHKQEFLPGSIVELSKWLKSVRLDHLNVDIIPVKEMEWKLWAAVLQKSAVQQAGMDTVSLIEYLLKDPLQLTSENLVQLSKLIARNGQPSVLQTSIDSLLMKAHVGIPLSGKEDLSKKSIRKKKNESSVASQAAKTELTTNDLNEELLEQQLTPKPGDDEVIEEEPDSAEKLLLMEEGIYVTIAGIVLLHPFLHNFFKKLNLVENGSFRDKISQERAICLLHEIASPGSLIMEHDLVLAKFLCKWPLEFPVNTIIEVSEKENDEMNALLQAAITQWEILKNTSPLAFQETFLQREGKLFCKNEKWYLHIEKKPVDILLTHLPWTISMIKLPWMKELLRVEWV